MKNLWYRFRLALPVLVILASLGYIFYGGSQILTAQLGVLCWKLVLLSVGVIVAHLVRCQLLPYIDLSAVLQEKSQAGGLVFLGVMLLYAVIIFSLCSGL